MLNPLVIHRLGITWDKSGDTLQSGADAVSSLCRQHTYRARVPVERRECNNRVAVSGLLLLLALRWRASGQRKPPSGEAGRDLTKLGLRR